ncbi:hypothetical protein AB4Z54_43365, partial [Streptomyces sp. MCAF7]
MLLPAAPSDPAPDSVPAPGVGSRGAACKDVKLNYKATGSGAGIQEWLQGKTAFAGSDSALKPE